MPDQTFPRRRFLTSAAAGAVATAAAPAHAALVSASDGYTYEVQRTDSEWRAMLSEHEFHILREGGTEEPKSSPYWNSKGTGIYHCKGCDLPVYNSDFKLILSKGWVFFFHAMPNNVLLGIDRSGPTEDGEADEYVDGPAGHSIEIHCRRCGSHFGHVLFVSPFLVNCTNGAALNFRPADA